MVLQLFTWSVGPVPQNTPQVAVERPSGATWPPPPSPCTYRRPATSPAAPGRPHVPQHSSCCTRARADVSPSSASARSPAALSRLQSTTKQPAARSALADSAPMPLFPPVTTATPPRLTYNGSLPRYDITTSAAVLLAERDIAAAVPAPATSESIQRIGTSRKAFARLHVIALSRTLLLLRARGCSFPS